MQHKAPWWVGPVLALAVVVAFAWFVWPTPWVYSGGGESVFGWRLVEERQHLITGERQIRGVSGEWVSVPVDGPPP